MDELAEVMRAHADDVDAVLAALLDKAKRPARLMEAMRHAVFAGGKRMRPFLVIESAALFGVRGAGVLRVAAALEMVHCYSLVHDDLPAMDDDDMRRGQPTVHRAYDEATAILAGDGLLTLAFAVIAESHMEKRAGRRARLISNLAVAAGVDGMVGGQMLDLAAEGRFDADGKPRKMKIKDIQHLQALKTGALIGFAAEAGAVLAPRASAAERKALKIYGEKLGLAFQIKDDLLDLTGNAQEMGKAVAKDAAAGKATMAGLLGVDRANALLERTGEDGIAALKGAFGDDAKRLCDLMRFNQHRTH